MYYSSPTWFGIADHEIGRLSQRQGTVRRMYRYKLVQIRRLGLAVPTQTMLRRPAIYRKTPVQSRANLTVYIHTISGRDDLTCMPYIVYFVRFCMICAGIGLVFL